MGTGYPDSTNVKAGAKAIKYHLDYMHWLLDHRRWLAGDVMTLADFAAAAHLSSLDYISDVGLEPVRGGQGLVRDHQVAPGFPRDTGRSDPRLPAPRALCRSGFLKKGGQPPVACGDSPRGIWGKRKR